YHNDLYSFPTRRSSDLCAFSCFSIFMVISVDNLAKYYRIHQKTPGFVGSMNSLFNRKYYDAKAVDTISFSIEEGELVGFIGPNGDRKSTRLNSSHRTIS